MPGYTHLQTAQPVLLAPSDGLLLDAERDKAVRLRYTNEAADVMPLGSAALAGTTFPIDRGWWRKS